MFKLSQSTPAPASGFPGLAPGDRWCLGVDRRKEALWAGFAPPLVLAATHSAALEVVCLDEIDAQPADPVA